MNNNVLFTSCFCIFLLVVVFLKSSIQVWLVVSFLECKRKKKKREPTGDDVDEEDAMFHIILR